MKINSPLLELNGNLSYDDSKRITDSNLFWKFYDGEHWNYKREEGETLVVFNYCKAIVDKSVSFLFGKGFSLQPEAEIEEIKPLIDEVWDYNNRGTLSIEIAQMGSITGDCFVKVAWEEPETAPDGVPYDEEYPNGKVKVSVLPSNVVFPEYSGHDKDLMTKCTIQYVVVEHTDHGIEQYLFKEEITRDRVVTYNGGVVVKDIDNPFKEINVVQIKNLPLAGSSFGQSDLVSIVPLQKELNAKITDVSDIINYHSAPVTVIQGARAKNLEKGAKKVWGGLPKDAKVYNLELNSDLNAANTFISTIKKTIHELSNTPENSLGSSGAVSNTTGVALQIMYSPLLEKTWLKRETYGRGIQAITRLIIKLLRIKGSDEVQAKLESILDSPENIKKAYHPTVVFADPLPKDEMVQMQIIAQKMNAGLEEPEGALRSIGYEGDISEKLEKIRAYQQEVRDMEYDNVPENTPAKQQFDASIDEPTEE